MIRTSIVKSMNSSNFLPDCLVSPKTFAFRCYFPPMLQHLLLQCFSNRRWANIRRRSQPESPVVLWISNRPNACLFAPAILFRAVCYLHERGKNSKQISFEATIVFVWILKAWTKNNSRNRFHSHNLNANVFYRVTSTIYSVFGWKKLRSLKINLFLWFS